MRAWMTLSADFLRGAWRRLPVETLAVAVAVASAIAAVHQDDGAGVLVARCFFGAVLVVPLAFAAHRRSRAVALGWGIAAAAAVGAAMVALLPSVEAVERAPFAWRYGLALVAATLAPFVTAPAPFSSFVRRFFEQATGWGIVWVVATGAVGVIVAALQALFHIEIFRAFADVALLVTGAVILSLLHRLLATDEGGGRMPELWRRLALAVGAPFVAVMLAILVVYELVVLARGELPQNVLSPLIMAAGFVGFLCTLIIDAVARERVGSAALAPADPHLFMRRWTVRLTRAFPVVLMALLPMAAWALWVRIDQYSLTPFRVVRAASLACLGVLSLLGTVRWLRGRPARARIIHGPTEYDRRGASGRRSEEGAYSPYVTDERRTDAPQIGGQTTEAHELSGLDRQVPAIVMAFALAAAALAIPISVASQRARLVALLDAAGLEDRRVPPVARLHMTVVPEETFNALRDSIQTLGNLGGPAALATVFTGEVAKCAGSAGGWTCLDYLGVRGPDMPASGDHADSADAAGAFPVDGGKLAFIFTDRGRAGGPYIHDHDLVWDRDGGAIERASLEELLVEWERTGSFPARPVPIRDAAGAVIGQLLVYHLDVWRHATAPTQVTTVIGAELRRD